MKDVAKGIILSERGLTYTKKPIEGDERVDLRERFTNVALVTLNHTPRHEQTAETSRFLQFGELQHTIDALFNCAFEEPTRVNDSDISAAEIVHDLEPRIAKHPDHYLRVYLILCASKGYYRGASGKGLALSGLRLSDIYGDRAALSRLVSERED
jgi:hypothetical protein